MSRRAARVMVLGLDCAPPALVFDRLRPHLPNLSRLMARGAHGPLRSVMPPITVPAWASMVSGRDPGELGVYGFRNLVPGGYALEVADARAIEAPRIWDLVGDAGMRSLILHVPSTWPPPAIEGSLVSGLLGPGPDVPHTHPLELAATLEARFGPHEPDVAAEALHGDADTLLDALYEGARRRFAIARALYAEERPELLMSVEMSPDRLHHALFRHLDPGHPRHEPGHRLVREARDFYAFLDAEVGGLIDLADDETAIMVVSDHGARSMLGGFRINEHLRREGWLTLNDGATDAAQIPAAIDPRRTRAWATGGYYARVFLNVEGRDPEGIVPAADYEAERQRLADLLEAVPGPDGEPALCALRPEDLYREVRGRAPDLLVLLGDLDYRALGSLGEGPLWQASDDRRADDCNHDWEGIFIAAGAGVGPRGRLEGLELFDVGVSALGLLGLPRPEGWLGRDVLTSE